MCPNTLFEKSDLCQKQLGDDKQQKTQKNNKKIWIK